MEAVVTHKLTRRFGDLTAVDEVDLSVPAGSIFGLLGPDGAGKSTLLRMIASVMRPDSGTASVFGIDVESDPDTIAAQIGYMSQQFAMYPDLNVVENINFFARLRGVDKPTRKERSQSLLASMGMSDFTKRRAGRLSGGMKQKLMLATTLMHEPGLLLLDEPTTGVDPVSRREFWEILARLREEGRTIIVATPYMDEAERCTHTAFLDNGRITRTGTPQQMKDLLPGVLVELIGPEPRSILARCKELPDVVSAHMLGESVRVLWTGGQVSELVALLAEKGCHVRAGVQDPDMEVVFAHLAEAS